MDEYTYETLKRYFKVLSNTGYKSYKTVFRLLLLSYINDIINNNMFNFISVEETEILDKTVRHLQGYDCLFKYINKC